jgi:hypothetical protein
MRISQELRLADELRDFLCDLPGPGSLSWLLRAEGSIAWSVSLCDRAGKAAEAGFEDLEAALDWLRARAIEFYPDSDFANYYGRD